MIARALRLFAFVALALLGVLLLVQLGSRANRAYDAATPIRNDMRAVTVLFDRAAGTGVAREGWSNPIPSQGVWSISTAPTILLPTSTAAGDVELILVMASGAPGLRLLPIAIKAGDTPVGVRQIAAWTPKGMADETVRIVVPRDRRALPYQLLVTFDLAQPTANVQPIRIVSASAHILRDP